MTVKFRAHETFFIRKGWLSKGMRNVKKDGELFVSKENNPMDVLGIGSNMVKSMRYWLQAVGLTEEPNSGKRIQSFTEFGKRVLEHDPYLEEFGTLCLLQYKLASNRNNATAWYFFFNEFNISQFTREDFISAIQNFILMKTDAGQVAVRSLTDDFNCIISTYLPRYKSNPNRVSPENNIDCPFGELGLIDILSKGKNPVYRKTVPSVGMFDPWVILAVIQDKANGRKEIPLNELLAAECNIGRVFNMDAITMLEVLHNVEKTGEIKIIRTAGLDVIQLTHDYSFIDCVDRFYESIEG